MSALRIACSPLTGTIYVGRVNKAGDAWTGQKTDVTSDALGAVIEKIGEGNCIVVNENGAPTYEIEVRKIGAASQALDAAAPAGALMRPLVAGLPSPDEHDRVIVYTDGVDFRGAQYFDIRTEDLWELDHEAMEEVAGAATHWMPHPDRIDGDKQADKPAGKLRAGTFDELERLSGGDKPGAPDAGGAQP